MHHGRLGVPVSIGVGATIDFLAGKFRRAPQWMQRSGAEWIFRLWQEPRRLFNRYLLDLVFFVRALRRERKLLRRRSAAPAAAARPSAAPATSVTVHRWSGEVDAAAIQLGQVAAAPAMLPGESLALDLSGVTFMDSAGIGQLVTLYRGRVRSGAGMVLISPSAPVRALLAALKLDRLIPTANEPSEVPAVLGLCRSGRPQPADDRTVSVKFMGELTAERVPSHVNWLDDAWAAKPAAHRLQLDFSQISFIDSSGLGLLIHAHKLAKQRTGAALSIRGAGRNVRNVTQLARVDDLFQFEDATA
jgi:N-acetylglucosaminyldiphosphoundecaprenol N-acetyl-beta-D-mannosaminyltransferase